jgi:hypothetical protein
MLKFRPTYTSNLWLQQKAGHHGRSAHNKTGSLKRPIFPMGFPIDIDRMVSEGESLVILTSIAAFCSVPSRQSFFVHFDIEKG